MTPYHFSSHGSRRTLARPATISAETTEGRTYSAFSGESIEDFHLTKYEEEYELIPNDSKNRSFIGKFIEGAVQQKGMVADEISKAGINHAGFVINKGDATCSDVLELCEDIKKIVFDKTGFMLELEPVILR